MESIEELQKRYKLSANDSDFIYQIIFEELTKGKKEKIKHCNLILGQQGSGKSTFSEKLSEKKGNAVVINGDFIRGHHPDIVELLKLYPNEYCYIIHPDWQAWKTKLIADLIKKGYEFNLEGACSDIEYIKAQIKELKKARYTVDPYILAVHFIESRLRMLERFCRQIMSSGTGRINDHERNQTCYDNITEMIRDLDLDRIQSLFLVDSSLISYPVSKSCEQKELLLQTIRTMNLTQTFQSFTSRINGIVQFLQANQGEISPALNERSTAQIFQLREDFANSIRIELARSNHFFRLDKSR